MTTLRARAHLCTTSPSKELGTRLATLAALVVGASALFFAVASAVSADLGSPAILGGGALVVLATALGLAPLAGAARRWNRRSSSAVDVALELSDGGLRCRELWGDLLVSAPTVRGVCVLDRPHEATAVVTLDEATTWLLELEDGRAAALVQAALATPTGFSGKVSISARSKAGGVGCLRLVSAGLVVLLWLGRGAIGGSYAGGFLFTLAALAALLPIAAGMLVELLDAGKYETLVIGPGEVRMERAAGGRLGGPFVLTRRDDTLEIRASDRPPLRVFDAELVSVAVLPVLARAIESARGNPG